MEIDENSIEIIKFKINEIKVNSEIESIKLKLNFKNVNPNDIDRKNAIELRGIWKDISKLSLGGYKEFPFFQQLFVRDVHKSPIYNTAMHNIGYKRVDRQWKLIRRPTLEVVVDHIYRYCLYSYIVESKKEIKGGVSSFRSDVIITEESSNSVQIKDSGACQIRNEVPNSKNHHWKCFFCDNENDDESMKCSVCYTAKDEMTSGGLNEQGGKTGTSPCRPESNTVVDKFNVSRQGDGRTINRNNSSDISMELCPRCKIRSVNKDKSMICRLCADELYMKEMKELDVWVMSNRVDNRQDTSVGRHVDEKMECEKSSNDHCGTKMVHNGGHSNIAGNVRYVQLSGDNAMAERSNQTREIESGMSSQSICGASEQGIYHGGVIPRLTKIEWSCPKCTMKNPVSNDKCTTCGIIGPNTNGWQCVDCKKIHSYDVDKCGDCGGLGPHYGKWRCDQCTKINDKLARHCDVCSRNNMFINMCRRCHRNDVNVKYNELCDECLSGERKLEGTDHARVTTSVTINIGDKSPTKSDNDGPGEDKWCCTACSMINSLDVDKCGACEVEGPHFNKWICYHCKERNSYDVDKCGDCGGHGPHYGKWRCDQCTKINDKLARRCDVCDAENYGIMKCPQCHVADINSKCDTRCRECRYGLSGGKRRGEGNVRQIVVDRGDGSDIPREDGWSCGKCARHNPYDLVMCGGGCGTMGPHYDKWRCDKCTCLNDRWRSECSACHEYQRDRHIYTLATSGGGESGRDVCRGKCAERGDTLCYLCTGRYYKCKNTKCKKINSNDDKFCRHCGVKRGSSLSDGKVIECRIDGGIRKMWQCTFTKCMHLNSEYSQVCIKCDCLRYTLYYYRCTHCGWIHYYPGRCTKCYPVIPL